MKPLALFLCETRPLPNLIPVINNHLKFCPATANLFIYHSKENKFLKIMYPNSIRTEIDSMNERKYNELLTSTKFWSQFLDYRRILLFQHDSVMLRKGIEEFLDMPFGYYGASFWFQPCGGNGGSSLRDPKLMYEICSKYKWDGYMNEDIYFSNTLCRDYPDRMAPKEVNERFSVESVFKLGSLFTHCPEKWLTKEECELIKNQYNASQELN